MSADSSYTGIKMLSEQTNVKDGVQSVLSDIISIHLVLRIVYSTLDSIGLAGKHRFFYVYDKLSAFPHTF